MSARPERDELADSRPIAGDRVGSEGAPYARWPCRSGAISACQPEFTPFDTPSISTSTSTPGHSPDASASTSNWTLHGARSSSTPPISGSPRRWHWHLFDGTVRGQDLPRLFFEAFNNVAAREAYWRAFRARYRDRIAPLEGLVRHSALSSLAQLTPPALSAEVEAFLAELDEPDSGEIVARTRESLRLQSRAARRIEDELSEGLA